MIRKARIRRRAKQLFQLIVNDTYDDFVSGVAERRGIDKPDVDAIAQGQVWTGRDALENGLIDELGTFDDAISAAAELADLPDGEYGQKTLQIKLSPTEQMVLDFLSISRRAGLDLASLMNRPTALESFANNLQKLLSEVTQFNDPKGTYSHCFCEID